MLTLGIYRRALTRSLPRVRFNSTSSSTNGLSWVEYFQLKKQNNRINAVSGIFTGLGGAMLTLTYLGNIEIDLEKPMFGFDPLMVMGGGVIAGGLLGYLLGPVVGQVVFKTLNRLKLKAFDVRNSQFLSRLKVKRPDPSSQSFSNPIPDYYGERIYSLKDYRQWLRDCNAFRRKAKEFI
ncbi:Presequence translocated-associated motor subunit PAM17, mitochondrial [Candida parapsilosis]|uniref:Presequence translocated-associated motor subunit PAM17 n=1 Tax=Candida parapsilosis TaxID=5480 RepID=A0A8X7NMW3_CANPA|nr:Presequence translocated-associated motor subunit PAM17, mitochondrial [Candida parapsilosis]